MRGRVSVRGASLLELLVALSLFGVITLVSTALLAELFAAVAVDAREVESVGGPTDLALARFEADVRRAVDLPGSVGELRASPDVLLARQAGGEVVVWRVEVERLLRGVVDADGASAGERVLLDGLLLAEIEPGAGRVVRLTVRRDGEATRFRAVLPRAGPRLLPGVER